jgi:hypothetical protein
VRENNELIIESVFDNQVELEKMNTFKAGFRPIKINFHVITLSSHLNFFISLLQKRGK